MVPPESNSSAASYRRGIVPGVILANRYRVLKILGQGGFGRTYLAADQNRFDESCVLKEFAPQVQGATAIAKAKDLFHREAGVLYRLQHPQIPKFRELLQARHQRRDYLLLVQDYVEGQTYRDLLRQRLEQGDRFREAEIRELLLHVLPILAYIHTRGVIHRDISPDNLICRLPDCLPVLIDFGGVKQAAASVLSSYSQAPTHTQTRLGKVGYAPPEQMQQGSAFAHSDLYALAASMLVLLTGHEPQTLLNSHTLEWQWQTYAHLSPDLAAVLKRMLALRPSDRYPSASTVLTVLQGGSAPATTPAANSPVSLPTPPAASLTPPPNTAATVAVGRPRSQPAAGTSNVGAVTPDTYAADSYPGGNNFSDDNGYGQASRFAPPPLIRGCLVL
ncbi:MAG: protein kinase, partial [Cyanobacteria bacterium P01_H01_bin.121]